MGAPTFQETYGAMFIGIIPSTFLQGVLTVQLYHYFVDFPRDSIWLKTLVSVTWILDLVHLICTIHPTYWYLVINWGNTEALSKATILFNLHLILISITSILCQAYFLRRVWLLSGKNIFLTGFLASMCLAVFGLNLRLTVRIMSNLSVESFVDGHWETFAVFVIGAISDFSIALVLCIRLGRERGEFRRTKDSVSRLINFTVATGLATSLLAVACAITYIVRPNTFIWIALHFSLGRMYTNALLATLNARKSLRPTLEAVMLSSDTIRSPNTLNSNHSSFKDKDGKQIRGVLVTTAQSTVVDPIEDRKYTISTPPLDAFRHTGLHIPPELVYGMGTVLHSPTGLSERTGDGEEKYGCDLTMNVVPGPLGRKCSSSRDITVLQGVNSDTFAHPRRDAFDSSREQGDFPEDVEEEDSQVEQHRREACLHAREFLDFDVGDRDKGHSRRGRWREHDRRRREVV